jgi:hypothetical protein
VKVVHVAAYGKVILGKGARHANKSAQYEQERKALHSDLLTKLGVTAKNAGGWKETGRLFLADTDAF